MKHLDISSSCYAHLIDNTIYLYINNEFEEMLHIDGIENSQDPVSLIMHEVELSSRPSLYECIELMN